ncbi:short-chain dehydrogenase [Streptomyces sulfonofaciens]|uniref:Short-chain dehydrogenase n=1 Tax=Streptomyces sulfonofaciens TaxID=68272 RepID=A0A919G898_9ACTN|nr:SDR family oxidoreductase [Streptomyces sulfonofaciens]GHH79248.1 short-chain dehydrogenase [Streptomyces sulfonofaciens]
MDLTGQRVVLLGGTSGIGLATALAASAEGAQVVVASSRQASVDKALTALPSGAEGYAVNLADADETATFLAGLGEFDHLVYTAGEPLTLMPLDTLDMEQARSFFTLRFFSALNAARAAAAHLRPGGSITLTTGTAKDRPGPGWAVAASICGAVEALTRALAVELAPLRVNAVSPGVVRSPLWSGLSETDREAMFESIGTSLPVGRVGEVEDVAQAYLYLLGQSYTTGTVLTIDGGTILV